MMAVMDGQTDLFDLLETPKEVAQPVFEVHLTSWRGKATCGWCGGSGLQGGGACRHPRNANVSIGYDYCQKCVDKYGHPRLYGGGTPIRVTAQDHQRIICPFCMSGWGKGLKLAPLEGNERDHEEAEPGRCAHMVARGVTEPYYTARESPWLPGFVVQYPRPRGFAGLYQLRGSTADRGG